MTDIKNKIEEEARKYAEAYGRNIVPIHNDLSVYYTDCYEAGARSILEKWKDASRWRKVSDELPKVASKPYCIVVRDDDGRVQLEWILVGYDEGVISFLLDKYVEWKPID